MAFFGRRRPGFSKEVSITEEELTDAINDRNNGTFRSKDDSPKTEKREWKALADKVLGGKSETAEAATAPEVEAEEGSALTQADVAGIAKKEGTRRDLFEYLDSLPDVDDPFPPMEEEPEEEEEELSEAQLLADFIRERSNAALLTSLTYLKSEIANLDELLPAMAEDPECATIKTIKGAKDVYYYDNDVMTDNYAMIAVLIEDNDTPHTIAQMVRWNAKTYPSPTPVQYFMRHPYNLSEEEMEAAMNCLESDEQYKDIHTFRSDRGTFFFYPDGILTARYAKALADRAEDDENG